MADQAQTALFLVVSMAAAMFALVYHVSKLNKRIQKLEVARLSTECVDASAIPDSEFVPISELPSMDELLDKSEEHPDKDHALSKLSTAE